MKLINIPQGTPEWLDFRRDKIGSSDAAAIMGISPWKTPYQLMKQKLEGTGDKVNSAMKRGTDLEPEARERFIHETGISLRPAVAISEEHPWQMTSLDGISEQGKIILEIKCGGSDLHEMAKQGEVPEYYMCQIQHHIGVVNPEEAYYGSYYKGELEYFQVQKDRVFIQEMTEKELEFWKMMMAQQYPDLTDKDFDVLEHARGSELLREYRVMCDQSKEIDRRKEMLKEAIIEINPGRNFILDGTKIYQGQVSSLDQKRMKEDGIDVDKYKKMSVPFWKISLPRLQGR